MSDNGGGKGKSGIGVYALSDIHLDNEGNKPWFQKLLNDNYADDTLILAGDVSDDLDLLKETLTALRGLFDEVFFVPGNHELWINRSDCDDSLVKFWQIIDLCKSLNVNTSPAKVGGGENGNGIWILPLFSWYRKPEESDKSLYYEKQGDDPTLEMWCDTHFVKWPSFKEQGSAAEYFLHLNEKQAPSSFDAPVISFSHFLPRRDLIFSTQEERKMNWAILKDPHPAFNFSRVAGCSGLEEQIRKFGSIIHVYGHQHRNRHRMVDDILYISHCLGSPLERQNHLLGGGMNGPKLIWEEN